MSSNSDGLRARTLSHQQALECHWCQLHWVFASLSCYDVWHTLCRLMIENRVVNRLEWCKPWVNAFQGLDFIDLMMFFSRIDYPCWILLVSPSSWPRLFQEEQGSRRARCVSHNWSNLTIFWTLITSWNPSFLMIFNDECMMDTSQTTQESGWWLLVYQIFLIRQTFCEVAWTGPPKSWNWEPFFRYFFLENGWIFRFFPSQCWKNI